MGGMEQKAWTESFVFAFWLLHRISYDPTRYPKYIPEAYCLCKGCLTGVYGEENFHFRSTPVLMPTVILRRTTTCTGGRYVYTEDYVTIPVGCTCVPEHEKEADGVNSSIDKQAMKLLDNHSDKPASEWPIRKNISWWKVLWHGSFRDLQTHFTCSPALLDDNWCTRNHWSTCVNEQRKEKKNPNQSTNGTFKPLQMWCFSGALDRLHSCEPSQEVDVHLQTDPEEGVHFENTNAENINLQGVESWNSNLEHSWHYNMHNGNDNTDDIVWL